MSDVGGYLKSLFSLEGRTALVTGATRGIGHGIALAFAKAGAQIILVQVRTLFIKLARQYF